jgi:hypothetical protein
MTQETRYVQFDGHRLAYRVSGQGPALVVLSLYRRREDMMEACVLSDTYQVFQVATPRVWRQRPRPWLHRGPPGRTGSPGSRPSRRGPLRRLGLLGRWCDGAVHRSVHA